MISYYDSIMTVIGSSILIIVIYTMIRVFLNTYIIRREGYWHINMVKVIIIGTTVSILLITLAIMTYFRMDFYTKTYAGRTYSIKVADEYLTDLYPNKKYKLNSMDENGVVKYTIWVNKNPVEKTVNFDIYFNRKKSQKEDDSIDMIPFFVPIRL